MFGLGDANGLHACVAFTRCCANPDQTVVEVDVFPLQRCLLTKPQICVDGKDNRNAVTPGDLAQIVTPVGAVLVLFVTGPIELNDLVTETRDVGRLYALKCAFHLSLGLGGGVC